VKPARTNRDSTQAGYSGTPLLQKLGVKEGTRFAIVNPPRGFVNSLPALPKGARLSQRETGEADVILWFVMSRVGLESLGTTMKRMRPTGGMLWIAWPKKASKVASDLTEDVVRVAALEAGLVDTKVCAIDETWSGLRLSRRRLNPSG
jgi:hypothetical protein